MEKYCALKIENISVAYDSNLILDEVSFVVPQGVFAAIIGPNGAGKTTLLKVIVNIVTPRKGSVHIFSQQFSAVNKKIAYIAQRALIDWDFPVSVFDVVLMGRYGYLGWAKRPQAYDYNCAMKALEQVDLVSFRNVHINELSGGQQQRMFIARALAQNAELYILDEPFAAVDKISESIIVNVFKELAHNGKTVVIVHHDLSLLENYFDWLIVIDKQCKASGEIHSVLNTSAADKYTLRKN